MAEKNREKKVINRRLLAIDEEIRSGTYPNSKKLADMLETSTRTILRDIDELKLFYRAPIEYDYTRKGFYYTESNFFIKSVMLTENEFKAITVYDDFLKNAYKGGFDINLRKAIGKILAVMPGNKTKGLSYSPSDENDFLFEPTVVCDPQIWTDINTALLESKVIEIEYQNIDKNCKMTLSLKPLEIYDQGEHWHLLAMDSMDKNKIDTFFVDKIITVHITRKRFKLPKDFEIPYHTKRGSDVLPQNDKVYDFELSFHKEVASEARGKFYYHNQTIESCKDGTVLVKFRTTQLLDVFHWVLGQGYKVKVLNPPELVSMMKKTIMKINKYYIY